MRSIEVNFKELITSQEKKRRPLKSSKKEEDAASKMNEEVGLSAILKKMKHRMFP